MAMISVDVVKTGARTPLGLQAAASAAAYRAGISGMGEHPFMVDRTGDPMPGALDTELDPVLIGPDRLLALAEPALLEAGAALDAERPGSLQRIPVYLALPEVRPGFSRDDAVTVQAGLSRLSGSTIQISEVKVATEGHAGGLAALASAANRIQRGEVEACLVGGVESYFQPDTMEWLDSHRQLVGATSRSGFVPGEGAAFCLLMSERARERRGLTAVARVISIAVAMETKLIKTSDTGVGAGLTDVVRQVVASPEAGVETVHRVICDINGERYRSEEWGFTCLRLSHFFDDPTAYDSPADCWGDMGAASAPLFMVLACEASARGYATGARTLVWASSEGGLRGAALLETPVAE